MRTDDITICAYCGQTKAGLSFAIGAASDPDWTMIEGTGKITCPDCYRTAESDGQSAIRRATGL